MKGMRNERPTNQRVGMNPATTTTRWYAWPRSHSLSSGSTSASILQWSLVPACPCVLSEGGWHHTSSICLILPHSSPFWGCKRRARRARTQHTSSSYVLLLLPSPCVSADRYAAVGGAMEVWINLTTAWSNRGRMRERKRAWDGVQTRKKGLKIRLNSNKWR